MTTHATPILARPEATLAGESAMSPALTLRTRRVAGVAAACGAAGAAGLATFLLRSDFVALAVAGAGNMNVGRRVAIPALLGSALFLFALQAFYGLRLLSRPSRAAGHVETGDAATADGLFKLRLACGPLLVVLPAAVAIDMSVRRPFGSLLLAGIGVAGAAACCWTLIQLRRAAWDLALATGASVAGWDGRGFNVLPARPLQGVAQPGPSRALADDAPPHPRAQPLTALPVDAAAPDATSLAASRDWEVLLHAAAIAGLVLSATQLPLLFDAVAVLLDPQATNVRLLPRSAVEWMVTGPLVVILAVGLCHAMWALWGVLALAAGPRHWRAVVILCGLTLLARTLGFLLRGLQESQYPFGLNVQSPFAWIGSYTLAAEGGGGWHPELLRLDRWAFEVLYPAAMLVLLTRRPIKEFFARRLRAENRD